MSLLLDALKKAAQTKAKNDGAANENIDATEMVDNQNTVVLSQGDESELKDYAPTVFDGTDATTEVDTAYLDRTEVNNYNDPTQYNSLDNVSVESSEQPSEIEKTSQMGDLYRTTLQNHEDGLTEDDVTEFMGDGISQAHSTDAMQSSDDTAVTMQEEGLELTNYSFVGDDSKTTAEHELETDETRTDLNSFHKEARNGASLYDHTLQNQQILSEDEQDTRVNPDITLAATSVDIEKLTNEETVTAGYVTSTRNFAPDNYDRTLLNLSAKESANMFPGNQSESDLVMTPDYAKRVFISKSGQFNIQYYKVFTGVALILLLSVSFWGMLQFQDESDRMYQGLVGLKQDPLPGPIKQPVEDVSKKLFTNEPEEADLRTADIVLNASETTVNERESVQETTESDANTYTTESTPENSSPGLPSNVVKDPVIDKEIRATQIKTQVKKVTGATSPTSNLTVSSSRKISRKSQLLLEAYTAYENGEITQARSIYDEVLVLDRKDRDGLLGRAAIHILDNEYEQAINKYQQLLLRNPKDSMAMASLISVANIDPKAGETKVKSLLRDEPKSAYLHFLLGNMYGTQNRWSEAQSSYYNALQEKPDDPNYAYNLAVSLEHIGQAKVARTFYQKAINNSSNGLTTFDAQQVIERIGVLEQ